jgi:hypothetical protein
MTTFAGRAKRSITHREWERGIRGMESLLVSGRNRNRLVSGRPVWLREALVAVVGAVAGRLPLEMLIALALSIAALFTISAGIAHAEPPRLIPDGQFESEGAVGVAVDQSSSESDPSRGDVYVAGFLTFGNETLVSGRVGKFDASGNVLSPPPPFGEAVAYSGAAVNPENGDVYALDALGSQIDTYDSASGELLGSFPVEPASGNYLIQGTFPSTVVGIASDSAGNVYVPVVPENEVLEYSPTGEELKKFKGSSGPGELKRPTGVSVDPAGNVWVADAGNGRVVELSPAGAFVREIASEGVQSLAVDAHGDVFALVDNSADFCGKLVAPCSHLVEYGVSGAWVADVGAGELERVVTSNEKLPKMLAVSEATGRVYVTDSVLNPRESHVHGRVLMFTPPVPPKLEGELAAEVGETKAKLGAVVNPGGISAAYRFEYGTTTAYGKTVPFPEGDTGGGFHARTVWAAAAGLAPGTTYHYRVVVTGELGEPLVGKDQTFTTGTAAQTGCPNEQFRTGFSARLPDCRAYELVTPPNDASAQPDPNLSGDFNSDNVAAVDGSRMAFKAIDVFPGSPSGGFSYVATRGADGWSSENVIPPQNYYGNQFCKEIHMKPYSADLSKGIIELDAGLRQCGGPEPELVAGEPKGVNNLYLRDNTNGSYQLINMPPPGVTGASAQILAASADLGHVLFREQAQLTSDAPAVVANVYEWSGGALSLLRTVLPDGTPVAGELANPLISRDGSRIFFTYAGGLYAQSGGNTVQLDASQTGGGGGGGSLAAVSEDGSHVFFTDANRLTADSTAEAGKSDLYRYDFTAREGERLTDLTVDASEPANVQQVRGVSEDGSYVYFEADGVLAGSVANASGDTPQAGQPNLYVWHGGRSTFIATQVAIFSPSSELVQVTANGAFLAIATTKRLTAYDNTDANTGQPESEIYLYSAAANSLVCASCNPGGQRPTSSVGLEPRAPRNVSNNGQVFFNSSEALLPADINGQLDVYEFEADGVGSCSDPRGCVLLLSTGTGSRVTTFLDASLSGNDVFLREYQKLVPQDKQEEARVIYDVRVNGGIPEPASPPACATADACRTAPAAQPSIFGAPASQTFSGAGDLTPPTPVVKPKTAAELRVQKLARALKVCRKAKSKKKRAACDKQARKKYGPAKKAKKSTARKVSTDRRAK